MDTPDGPGAGGGDGGGAVADAAAVAADVTTQQAADFVVRGALLALRQMAADYAKEQAA